MSKINSVSDFLTDLASAIKTKKGSSTAINAQNFANEIIALQAGLSPSSTEQEALTTQSIIRYTYNGSTFNIVVPNDFTYNSPFYTREVTLHTAASSISITANGTTTQLTDSYQAVSSKNVTVTTDNKTDTFNITIRAKTTTAGSGKYFAMLQIGVRPLTMTSSGTAYKIIHIQDMGIITYVVPVSFSSTDNLSQYLTNIADAIRAKKGTSATINAQDFATEVLNLSTETVPTTLTKTLAATRSNSYAATTNSVAIDATKTTWVEDMNGNIVKITTANNSLSTAIYVYPSGEAQSGPAQGQTLHGQAYLSSSGDTLYYYKPQYLMVLPAMKYDQT